MKTINRNLFVLLAGMLLSSCVERYFPTMELNSKPQIVIEGSITTEGDDQEIVISESSSLDQPKFNPVSGCNVRVEDDKGHRFPFSESNNAGHYHGIIDEESIIIGVHYRLFVQMPNGENYISKFEKLLPCPSVDSVYFELESKPTDNAKVTEDGLQFFIDFKGNDNYGHFFRWQLVETYEYHSSQPLERWLDIDGYHNLAGPDYSNYICYKTDNLRDIFVLSTEGFTQNSYKKFRLNFVNDHTQRLLYKYSLLVKQYSLSEEAYNFWRNLKKNNQETVDLFGTQPAKVTGNIYNEKDTTHLALGYFSVSSVTSKRILIHSIKGLSFSKVEYCKAQPLNGPLPSDRPLYFADADNGQGGTVLGIISEECIFCKLLGGTTVKPQYWDEK